MSQKTNSKYKRDSAIALKFRDVAIFRGKTKIAGTMSMEFPVGSVSGFFGDNGSGKSSILKAAAGILTQEVQGRIVWFEQYDEWREALRNRIGVQLQSAPIFANLTVREQLQLVAGNRAVHPNRILSSLDQTFDDFPILHERQDVRGSALNGGTKRILSIGLASIGLMEGILILDEPTNDLGRDSTLAVGASIRRLAERDQNAVIVVSHDFQWLRKHCERVFTMPTKRDSKRVVESKRPMETSEARCSVTLPGPEKTTPTRPAHPEVFENIGDWI